MDHGGDSGGSSTVDSCKMKMYFHARHCEQILWLGWFPHTVTNFVLSAIAIFLLSFLYEALKFLREQLQIRDARKEAEKMALELRNKNNDSGCSGGCSNAPLAELREKTYTERLLSSGHIVQTFLILIQIFMSYMLMLIFMTMNYWLCLSVILGLGVGYFCFGWIKKEPETGECCP
ncbi:high affinity copper uptake protein 1-like [Scaptodrosophila lebanonensis]|uniref:Copper transport protein n=1 Tax=Drosophila lebanonensis TaxID=7225 RepID=A0A6J2T2P0_DROLE|nr:high affinity copper uptake protein 1-like [Scaptodrosophila lebanonensis]